MLYGDVQEKSLLLREEDHGEKVYKKVAIDNQI